MSRSNPNENGLPNPSTRWFEWSGEKGVLTYYDKEQETRVDVGADFKFMLLDQLSCVRGWHDPSESRIYSNEVRDTRQDVLVVKSFKGGTLAEGLYKDIKDAAHTQGGRYVSSCYIAFKSDDGLAIGNIGFKGAALREWMEFCKQHRGDLYKKAIRITGIQEGKKGRVVFRMPIFGVADVSKETHEAATALDRDLQEFLTGYLKKNKLAQAETAGRHVSDEEMGGDPPDVELPPITDDDIPF